MTEKTTHEQASGWGSDVRVKDLIKVVDTAKLDGRTNQAKLIDQVQGQLIKNPKAVSEAVLRASIAFNTAVLKEAMEQALGKEGKIVDGDGRLTPLVGVDIPRLQKSTQEALRELAKINPKVADEEATEDDYAALVMSFGGEE